jgi:hypothetical protein
MPLYSYTPELAQKVESGDKCQTYRAKRTVRPKVGQQAHNYAGSYSKKRKHLGSPVITDVIDVLVGGKGIIFYFCHPREYIVNDQAELDCEARLDGFENWHQMRDYIADAYGLPADLELIKWESGNAK